MQIQGLPAQARTLSFVCLLFQHEPQQLLGLSHGATGWGGGGVGGGGVGGGGGGGGAGGGRVSGLPIRSITVRLKASFAAQPGLALRSISPDVAHAGQGSNGHETNCQLGGRAKLAGRVGAGVAVLSFEFVPPPGTRTPTK